MPGEVTQLLRAWAGGDCQALDRMTTAVYDDLRRIAKRQVHAELHQLTLQGTALVHEAFLRLRSQAPVQWQSREHFFAWMATLMQHILVDRARRRYAAKRGAGLPAVSIDEDSDALNLAGIPSERDEELLVLDEALSQLEQLDPRQVRVIRLRFFVGLSIEETASALNISASTVKREWLTGRAWLLRRLQSS
jgi:RNA polymerase sigma factor (TIGR02999 family)